MLAPETPIERLVPTSMMRDVQPSFTFPWFVDETALTARLRESGVALVVLNGCSVERTAQTLSGTGASVLCHRGEVRDE
ncbi:MAG: hypothetical protein WCG47_09760 [Dermatophilaceae bacterium]